MKYAVEMGYIPSFIKIGSDIQKVMERGRYTDSTGSHKPTFFFQNKESRIKYTSW
jgi:hypothetical protein